MSSIEHRTSGRADVWRVRFREDGRNRAITFDTEESARKWSALLDAVGPSYAQAQLLVDQDAAPTTPTLAEHIRSHIDALTGVTEGTRRDYRSYVTRDIEPHAIGHMQVGDVDRAAVSAWIQWLTTRGMAGKTIANRHGLMSSALASAVEKGYLDANPSHKMRLPRTTHTKVEHEYLTREEFAQLLGLVREHYRPLVMLLVGTGMRFGEATALEVRDVNLAKREIRVRRSWKRTGKAAPELGPTKSRRSDRTVQVPPQVAAMIEPFVKGRPASALLLTNTRGGAIRQSPFWNRVWAPAVREFAGDRTRIDQDSRGRPVVVVVERGPGKHPRIHDLRHTFASWAIQNNVPLPVIQRQLGHESITTTIDTYGHLARSDFDALAQATGAMLPAIEAPKEKA